VIALADERKQEIIDKESGGIWFVLNEESPRDTPTAADLLCDDLENADSSSRYDGE
jgi:hypothetical protein